MVPQISLHELCIHEYLGINHLSVLAFELLVICYCDIRVHVLLKNIIIIKLHSADCKQPQPAAIKLVAAITKQRWMLALCLILHNRYYTDKAAETAKTHLCIFIIIALP